MDLFQMFDIGHNPWGKIIGDLSTLLPTNSKNFMNLILLRLSESWLFFFHIFHK